MNYGSAPVCLYVIFVFFLSFSSVAQNPNVGFTPGKGLSAVSADSNAGIALGSRFQFQAFANIPEKGSGMESETDFLVRRFRLTLKGFFNDQGIDYFIQTSFDRSSPGLKQAYLRWTIAGNARLWFGQNKMPLTREHLNSHLRLQFVQRSIIDGVFRAGIDPGIGFENETSLGGSVLRQRFAVGTGDGIGGSSPKSGLMYTGKLIFFPFGSFQGGKGYLEESDPGFEESPKLGLGIGYSVNNNASRLLGARGAALQGFNADIRTLHTDMIFKYRGFSTSGSFSSRESNRSASRVFEGDGWKVQAGYMVKKNFEVAFRWAEIRNDPDPLGFALNDRTAYTFGITRYVLGHELKAMLNGTYLVEELAGPDRNSYVIRFQIQFHI